MRLTYTEKEFKPKFIIDSATLTGAIIMALGEEYAGFFQMMIKYQTNYIELEIL